MGSHKGLAVFDIDGTLTDSNPAHQASLLEVLSAYRFPRLNTDWGSYRNHTDSGIFHDCWKLGRGSGPSPDDFDSFVSNHEASFRRYTAQIGIAEIPGAKSFVRAVREDGWAICFATGSIRSLAMDKLAAADIEFDPDLMVTASEFRTRKSIVRHAIMAAFRKHDTEFSQIVSVGDGLWDQKTARSLGLAFMAVGRRWTDMIEAGSAVVDFRDVGGGVAALSVAGTLASSRG